MYTTSFAFFEALWDAGVTNCFVNLGSDHPSIMEAIVKGQREKKDQFPRIFTCPNEMVALSMADGYARVTNKPQAVIIHVDVGTSGLGAAVHNASAGRCPVLIFAGLSPCTLEGEYTGSRTEYIHWLQDVPDQQAIVAQYCRYSNEIKRGKNVKQLVNRALSFAKSEPRGPVYLVGTREAMEENIEPYTINQAHWTPIEYGGLKPEQVHRIGHLMLHAAHPLVIIGYGGRNREVAPALVKLADLVPGLRVLDTAGSDMCFPANHPAWLGLRMGIDASITIADVIVVVDCDVPWINTQCKPKPDTQIVHIDVDPLKPMPVFYIDAIARYRADAETAINQITEYLHSERHVHWSSQYYQEKDGRRTQMHKDRLKSIEQHADSALHPADGSFGCAYLMREVKMSVPKDTIWVVEAVTNTQIVADAVQATIPGSWVNCGGGGLGWSGGGALGVKLASQAESGGAGKFVCQVVGDGSYMFSVPSTVYWISQRYDLPILTIVLNNKGWNAPRKSLLLVHPDGYGSKVNNEELNISMSPTPDFAGIAYAASGGKAWAKAARTADDLKRLLPEAVKAVQSGVTAVLEASIDGPMGSFPGSHAALVG